MKKLLKNDFFLSSFLFFIITILTIFQSSHQDYTSIIDFDLTVIHNSLQLVSNEFPDFQDLTSYTHFLTYGIFYKLIGILDNTLVTNINLLVKNENPEIILEKLYILSRVANSTIHFVAIIFFYKILGEFKIKKYYKIWTIIFLILSETFIANLIILRTDIVAVCYFLISFFYLLKFVKNNKVFYLFLVSFFMIFALLAKVQIIFLFMFIFFFFIFYSLNEKDLFQEKKNDIFIFKFFNKNLKYILLLLILIYFLFQIYLNNFVNTSGVGYFDSFCFGIYFLIIFLTVYIVSKFKKISGEYFYNTFCLIFMLSILNILFLKILNILGLFKINFNIIFSITNPFYFLKIYSPLDKEFSLELIYEMTGLLFNNFNFNILYTLFLLITLTVSIYKIFFKIKEKTNYEYIFILLFSLIVLFLTAMNNFRYNVSYNIYVLPFLFLSLAILFKSIKKKIIFSSIISSLIILNFTFNIQNYQNYIHKPSNLKHVCSNKSTRDFYYHWARNFNEKFFKKICLNNDLLLK